MKYNVLYCSSIYNLVEEVNEAIKNGWQPLGGICGTEVAFYQAMILEEE